MQGKLKPNHPSYNSGFNLLLTANQNHCVNLSRYRVTELFLESVLFSGQNKYTHFLTIFRHKTRVSSLQKVPKDTILSTMAITL